MVTVVVVVGTVDLRQAQLSKLFGAGVLQVCGSMARQHRRRRLREPLGAAPRLL